MIREVELKDSKAIADIYNDFILNSVISFETEPLSVEEMGARIASLSAEYPYYVYETDDGEIAGYCYAHEWKQRKAYSRTLETTVYVSPRFKRMKIGENLMLRLIDECRKRDYIVLIACITGGNEPSIALHKKLGFTQVSLFRNVGLKFGRLLDVVDMELLLK